VRPAALHHVSINVTDVADATRFYTEVLGATLRDDRPDLGFDGAWLDLGGQQLHLLEGETPRPMGQHFAILVEDLDGAVGELRARGVDVGDPSPIGDARQCFLQDPCGNAIELHERR
jgi:glyoxylase I family protein